MKSFILLLAIISSFTIQAQSDISALLQPLNDRVTADSLLSRTDRVMLIAGLKSLPPIHNRVAFVIGYKDVNDGNGAFFRFDTSGIGVEDTTFYNIITTPLSSTGRWKRVVQRIVQYPQGVLQNNQGFLTFYGTGITDASGNVTINLTTDNTATGPSLFKKITVITGTANTSAATVSDVITPFMKTLITNLKLTTWGTSKPAGINITLGQIQLAPVQTAQVGVPIVVTVSGI